MTIAPFTLRYPTRADAEAIASIHNDGWRDTYGRLAPESYYDDDALAARTATWTDALSAPTVSPRLFLAEVGDVAVGFAFAGSPRDEHPARDLALHMIYVRTGHHGSGVGQTLLDATLGRDPAQLWCAKENPRAIAFYRRNGFAPDGVEKVDSDANDLVEIRLVR